MMYTSSLTMYTSSSLSLSTLPSAKDNIDVLGRRVAVQVRQLLLAFLVQLLHAVGASVRPLRRHARLEPNLGLNPSNQLVGAREVVEVRQHLLLYCPWQHLNDRALSPVICERVASCVEVGLDARLPPLESHGYLLHGYARLRLQNNRLQI